MGVKWFDMWKKIYNHISQKSEVGEINQREATGGTCVSIVLGIKSEKLGCLGQ